MSQLYSNIKPYFNYDSLYLKSEFCTNVSWLKTYQKNSDEIIQKNAIILTPLSRNQQQFDTLYNADWIFIVILFMLSMLVFVKNLYYTMVKQIIKSFFNFQLARQHVNEKSGIAQKASMYLWIEYIIVVTSLIFLILAYLKNSNISYKHYIIILLSVSTFYVVKFIMYRFFAYVTNQKEFISNIISHYNVIYKNMAIFLAPFIMIGFYLKPAIVLINLILVSILFLIAQGLRIYRGLVISSQNKFLFLYIFLYLCGIELVSILFSIKLLIMWV